ncbi:MAG: hypothetical protein WBN51_10950 [Gammaproteobacteria bacterium]
MNIKSRAASIIAGIMALSMIIPGAAMAERDRSGRHSQDNSASHDRGHRDRSYQNRSHRDRGHVERSYRDKRDHGYTRHKTRDHKFAKNARKYYNRDNRGHYGDRHHYKGGHRDRHDYKRHYNKHKRYYSQPHTIYNSYDDDDDDEKLAIGLLLGGLLGYAISHAGDANTSYDYYDD